jgi:hypothetical protein
MPGHLNASYQLFDTAAKANGPVVCNGLHWTCTSQYGQAVVCWGGLVFGKGGRNIVSQLCVGHLCSPPFERADSMHVNRHCHFLAPIWPANYTNPSGPRRMGRARHAPFLVVHRQLRAAAAALAAAARPHRWRVCLRAVDHHHRRLPGQPASPPGTHRLEQESYEWPSNRDQLSYSACQLDQVYPDGQAAAPPGDFRNPLALTEPLPRGRFGTLLATPNHQRPARAHY